jgi:hypothetical protein
MVPVAPHDFTFERVAGADRHGQHHPGLGDRFDLDLLAESDVTVVDRFRLVLVGPPDAE